MSNPNLEPKVRELLELRRLREELDAEITAAEDAIKAVMGEDETLTAGVFKVSWKAVTSSRLDSTALKKAMPEIAACFMKQATTRHFAVNESAGTPTTAFRQAPLNHHEQGNKSILPQDLLPDNQERSKS